MCNRLGDMFLSGFLVVVKVFLFFANKMEKIILFLLEINVFLSIYIFLKSNKVLK